MIVKTTQPDDSRRKSQNITFGKQREHGQTDRAGRAEARSEREARAHWGPSHERDLLAEGGIPAHPAGGRVGFKSHVMKPKGVFPDQPGIPQGRRLDGVTDRLSWASGQGRGSPGARAGGGSRAHRLQRKSGATIVLPEGLFKKYFEVEYLWYVFIFCCDSSGPRGPDVCSSVILDVSVKVFLDEFDV